MVLILGSMITGRRLMGFFAVGPAGLGLDWVSVGGRAVEGVPSPQYDLAKSKKLLKESGYKGELIEATLPQGATVETAMTTIQAQLKKVPRCSDCAGGFCAPILYFP